MRIVAVGVLVLATIGVVAGVTVALLFRHAGRTLQRLEEGDLTDE